MSPTMSKNQPSPIIGRRAVYQTPQEKTPGVIVWIGTAGEFNYPRVIMLLDDGSLEAHSIENVTVEAEPSEGVYR